jgi:hypothetical protein
MEGGEDEELAVYHRLLLLQADNRQGHFHQQVRPRRGIHCM